MNKKVFLILIGLVVCNILAFSVIFRIENRTLKVVFFDIGQGDSTFIETPLGYQILVDGGPTSVVLEKLGNEMPVGDRTIDLIVLSHPDSDHISGLIDVLENYKVENILWSGINCKTIECNKWNKLLEKEQANVVIAEYGQKVLFPMSNSEQCFMEVLFPPYSLEGKNIMNMNNTSIVFRLDCNNKKFLFTGDIEGAVEKELLKNNSDVDVLKVAHHGSKTSTLEEFVLAFSPEVAVISCSADNTFGHPHQETLDTLDKYDINVLRTDLMGDIKFVLNKNNLKIKTNY